MKRTLSFFMVVLIVLTVFSLSGCKFSVVSADKLIRPPKSGAEIENAIEEFVGESILFKSPVSSTSEYNSPLTLIDLDSDGTEEAVVFYTTTSNDTSVHLNVLKHINDEWTSIGDFSGYGNNIESLSFRNLSANMSQYDIVATWSYIDSKVLTIHKVSGTGRRAKLKSVCNESYSTMGYVDVNRDGLYEIFIISGDFADKSKVPVAKVIRVEKYNILNIGMTSLSRDIAGFMNSYCQELSNDNVSMVAVYDFVNTNGVYGTDIVYWDCNLSSLNVMRVDSETNAAFSTTRNIQVASTDINADMYIDIPVQEQIIGSTVDNSMHNSVITYTKWCELIPESDGIKLKRIGDYRLYFTERDYFEINDAWLRNITVARNTKNDSWSVMSYNPEYAAMVSELLIVRNVTQDSVEEFVQNGYKQLSSNSTDGKVIVYMITDEGSLFGINDNDIVSINL